MILSVLFYVKHSNCAWRILASLEGSAFIIRVVAGVNPVPALWLAEPGWPLRRPVPILRVQHNPWGNKQGQDLGPEEGPGRSGQCAVDLERNIIESSGIK